uniref:Putative secreted protein n=1 Tax=Anopheles darlingi TaxID=43151 RepID=A0A2M4D3J9_ANODA
MRVSLMLLLLLICLSFVTVTFYVFFPSFFILFKTFLRFFAFVPSPVLESFLRLSSTSTTSSSSSFSYLPLGVRKRARIVAKIGLVVGGHPPTHRERLLLLLS